MKKLYVPLLTTIILLLTSSLPAVEITYTVTSGNGNTASLTTAYDLSTGSRANSRIDITPNPSISSHTSINAQGDENTIDITTQAHNGQELSTATINIIDNVDTATVNTNADASHSTHASLDASGKGAQVGLIKGESGDTKTFCDFTGDFTATSDTGGGNVELSTRYTNPKSNIFIVTKAPSPNCQGPHYDDIQPAVNDASNAGGRPDYIFVDHGGFTGAEVNTKDNLTMTGVWGADETTIDGRAGGGDTLYVHDSDNFSIEGFTVTGGTFEDSKPGQRGDGISIYNSKNAMVTNNTVNGNGEFGIGVAGNNAMVKNNTSNGNSWGGMYVAGDTAQVTGNTVNGNGWGIGIYDSNTVLIRGNTVSLNVGTGVGIYGTSNVVVVKENNIFGNGIGLENTTVNDVDATNNWWGPGGVGANAGKPGEGGNNGVVDSGGGTTYFSNWSNVRF